jgi:hypothetical protein
VTKDLPMSVIIVFPDGRDWFKANWVFRQLAQDVSDRYSSDAEVCKAVEVAALANRRAPHHETPQTTLPANVREACR